MATIRLVLDKAGLRDDARKAARPRVASVTRKIFNRSQVLCPVDSGTLRASGRMKFREAARGPEGRVEYTAKYAAAVHDGRGPQFVKATKKKALAFTWMGKAIVVKSSRPGGTSPRPFLVNAARAVAAAEGVQFKPRSV